MIRFYILTLSLVLVIILRYLHEYGISQRENEASFSEKTLLIYSAPQYIRYSYVFDTGHIRYILPEENQIEMGDLVYVRTEPGTIYSRVPDQMSYKKRLIVRTYQYIIRGRDSGKYSIQKMMWNIGKTREKLINYFVYSLPFIHARVFLGVLLGYSLDSSFTTHEDLIQSGLIHIMTVSGYNLLLFDYIFQFFFSRWRHTTAYFLLFLFSESWFILLLGISPLVMRSYLLVVFRLIARFLGKENVTLWFFFQATMIVLLWQPLLVHDMSFQLSTFALLGIYGIPPLFPRVIRWKYAWFLPFLYGMSIFMESGSIFLWYFHKINAIGILANALLLWMLPPITLMGFVSFLISHISPEIARLINTILWYMLDIFVRGIEVCARIPYTEWSFASHAEIVAMIWFVLFHIILISIIIAKKYRFFPRVFSISI